MEIKYDQKKKKAKEKMMQLEKERGGDVKRKECWSKKRIK